MRQLTWFVTVYQNPVYWDLEFLGHVISGKMPLGGIPQPQKGLPVGTGNVTIINRPSQPKPLVRVQQGLYQSTNSGLQIYGGTRSLTHDFKIWPITFQGSGPS